MKEKLLTLLTAFCAATTAFALYQPVEEAEPSLPLPNDSWKEIGRVRHKSSSEIKDSRISIGFECLDREMFEPDKVYDKLAATGIKWARCQTGWSKTEKVKGVYDFKWLDDVVDNLLKRGIKPWFNVGFGNGLYMGKMLNPTGVGYVPLYFGDECLQAWKNYIDALSKHYKGRVEFFEIWNESNIKEFWQPRQSDASEYVKLVKITGEIIRKNIPDAKIGAVNSGSLVGFTADFFKSGGGNYVDFYAIHPYCIIPEAKHYIDNNGIRKLFAYYNPDRKISLWQGESGFGSSYPKGHYMRPVTSGGEYMQAKWMLRRFTLDLGSDFGMTSLYQCVDLKPGYQMANGGKPLFAKYGLFENITYKPKKSVEIVSNYTPIFDSDTKPCALFCDVYLRKGIPEKLGESRLVESAKCMATFERKGRPLYAYWLAEDMQLQMKPYSGVSFRFINGIFTLDNPVLIDPISGRVFKYVSKIFGNNNGQFSLTGIPLADYPLVITDYEAVKDIIVEK